MGKSIDYELGPVLIKSKISFVRYKIHYTFSENVNCPVTQPKLFSIT